MSSITPATSTTNPTTSGTASSPTNSIMSKNQFLQLMMAQLQNQDPMSPNSSDPTAYVTQLAQFTALEQQTNTAQSTAQSAASEQSTAALALLGHTVNYIDSSGNSGSGQVQKVDFTSSGPSLTVNGVSGIDPNGVNEVS